MIPAGPTNTANTHQKPSFSGTWLKKCIKNPKTSFLHLTLKKEWFDLIASGEKKEEYREIKSYWLKRFTDQGSSFRHWDIVAFRNGYAKESPIIYCVFKGIEIGTGNPKWGAEPNKDYFIIKLGKLL